MDFNFEYELIFSKRKTLSIKITQDAIVKVLAPKGLSKKYIEDFLYKKKDWIESNLLEMRGRKAEKDSFTFKSGTQLLFYGSEFPLELVKGEKAGFDGDCFFVPQSLSQEQIRLTLKEVYRNLAKNYLVKRTLELAEKFGENINAVKINSAKSQWGSCSSTRNINLSLYLIMANPKEVDYCIIHELCHLTYMNHSKDFWTLVEKRDPDYKMHEMGLKEIGKKKALLNI